MASGFKKASLSYVGMDSFFEQFNTQNQGKNFAIN